MRVVDHITRTMISTLRETIEQLGYGWLRWKFRHNKCEDCLKFSWSSTNYNRTAVINLLLAHKPDGRYLEIGCANNRNFDAVMARQKIGIDPNSGGTHRMTSDEYFKSADNEKFDVIFIDGLHTYRQAATDVRNSLKFLNDGGWIVLHDMLPRDWLEEHVPRLSPTWMGDAWKVAFELARSKGLDFKILTIDFGLGIIRPLEGDSVIPDLSDELRDKRFPFLYQNLDKLPLTEYQEGRRWLETSN